MSFSGVLISSNTRLDSWKWDFFICSLCHCLLDWTGIRPYSPSCLLAGACYDDDHPFHKNSDFELLSKNTILMLNLLRGATHMLLGAFLYIDATLLCMMCIYVKYVISA